MKKENEHLKKTRGETKGGRRAALKLQGITELIKDKLFLQGLKNREERGGLGVGAIKWKERELQTQSPSWPFKKNTSASLLLKQPAKKGNPSFHSPCIRSGNRTCCGPPKNPMPD